MDRDKERQEISLIGRLLSMEALLVVMGVLSLVSGILAKDTVRLLLGLLILAGLFLLICLRRRRRRNNESAQKDDKRDA
jgi:membrane protein implicated in regulation of membrane protease activity